MKSIVCLVIFLGLAFTAPLRAVEIFASDELAIETALGEEHRITVELALSKAQQSQGLMYRQEMAADHGMLFI